MGNPLGAAAIASVTAAAAAGASIPAWKVQAACQVKQVLEAPLTMMQKQSQIMAIIKNSPEMLAAYNEFMRVEVCYSMGNRIGAAAARGGIPAWKMQAAHEVQQVLQAPGTFEQKQPAIMAIIRNSREMMVAYRRFMREERSNNQEARRARRAQAQQMMDQPGPSTRQ